MICLSTHTITQCLLSAPKYNACLGGQFSTLLLLLSSEAIYVKYTPKICFIPLEMILQILFSIVDLRKYVYKVILKKGLRYLGLYLVVSFCFSSHSQGRSGSLWQIACPSFSQLSAAKKAAVKKHVSLLAGCFKTCFSLCIGLSLISFLLVSGVTHCKLRALK